MMPTDADLTDIVSAVWESLLDESVARAADVGSRGLPVRTQIDIAGAWQGALRVECSTGLARRLTAQMLMLADSEVDEDLVDDAVGELANIIGGNVKALLPAPSRLGLPGAASGEDGSVVAAVGFAWHDQPLRVALAACHPVAAPGGPGDPPAPVAPRAAAGQAATADPVTRQAAAPPPAVDNGAGQGVLP